LVVLENVYIQKSENFSQLNQVKSARLISVILCSLSLSLSICSGFV